MALATAKKNTPAPGLVSMAPDSFTTGMFDDQDGTITDCVAATASQAENYTKAPPDTPLFIAEITDVNGSQHKQYWSLGEAADWQPSDDGKGFIPISGKGGINRTSNLGMFLDSLVQEGYPAESLASGDLTQLIGLKAHFIVKKTDRTIVRRDKDEAPKPTGVLIVNKIHALPGTKSASAPASKAAVGGKANGAATTAKTAAAKPADAGDFDDVDEILVPAVLEALGDAEGGLEKKQLVKIANTVFNTAENKALRNKAIGRANQPGFMAKLEESGVTVDGARLSL